MINKGLKFFSLRSLLFKVQLHFVSPCYILFRHAALLRRGGACEERERGRRGG